MDSPGSFFMVILEGTLELAMGQEVHVLTEGDSIYIEGPTETRSKNIGDIEVLAFAVASSPIV